MKAEEYRKILRVYRILAERNNKLGKEKFDPEIPPCYSCSDARIERCSETGYECSEFIHYATASNRKGGIHRNCRNNGMGQLLDVKVG